MRKSYLIVLLLIATLSTEYVNTLAEESKDKLTFRAKESALWFKHSEDKNAAKEKEGTQEEMLEASLPGELYTPSKKIDKVIDKKKMDLSTAEGVAASYFSASRKGDVKWIVENFVSEEKEKIKELFKKKEFLKERQKSATSIEEEYLSGKAWYKDYIILFIEQRYKDGKTITEPMACKQTNEGWKITNAISNDKTFDIVFAALASGEVTNDKGTSLNKDSLETKIKKPEIRIVR